MRLTKKIFTDLYASPCDEDTEEKQVEQQWKICNKLGQLEDVENDLGIDLITLFKIYKNGFAFKDEKNEIKQLQPEDLLVACIAIQPEYKRIISAGYYWYFKDYGKTWALTKEELL